MSARPAALATGIIACCLALVGFAAPAAAQDMRQPRVNYEYRLIEPQPVETGDKIEVVDFFWYSCPYCNELQPALAAWDQRKPADVVLHRIPVILRDTWVPHARVFYTLEAVAGGRRALPHIKQHG